MNHARRSMIITNMCRSSYSVNSLNNKNPNVNQQCTFISSAHPIQIRVAIADFCVFSCASILSIEPEYRTSSTNSMQKPITERNARDKYFPNERTRPSKSQCGSPNCNRYYSSIQPQRIYLSPDDLCAAWTGSKPLILKIDWRAWKMLNYLSEFSGRNLRCLACRCAGCSIRWHKYLKID